jgi:putative ABC transport system ATP-binding protein
MKKNCILEAKALSKSFAANGVQNHVLSNVDLEIYEGDFTVIMGSSGSGKSTLLYSLSGMDTITSGSVLFEGTDISKMKEKQLAMLRRDKFGFVFQQMNLVSNLSLYENVVVPAYLTKQDRKMVNQRADELLSQVGIDEQKKRLPSQVSGGEQQRTCMVRAIMNHPQIVFADEPTGALNKQTGIEVLDLMTQMNEQGQSILMVTHDVKAAARGNRILYIEDGKIVGELNLNRYEKENMKSAETQITSWLLARGW